LIKKLQPAGSGLYRFANAVGMLFHAFCRTKLLSGAAAAGKPEWAAALIASFAAVRSTLGSRRQR
jgi:hypothetical protein